MQDSPYLDKFHGGFTNMLRWPQLDTLWNRLRQQSGDGWYVYAVGETPPNTPLTPEKLDAFLIEIDALLRREHKEDYCGIVYVDEPTSPRMIKIYDPGNLGVVCGFSDAPPLPGWTLSLDQPCDLPSTVTPPTNRRRWWQQLFGR